MYVRLQRRYQLEQLFLQRISTAKEEAAAKQQLKRLDAAIKKAGKSRKIVPLSPELLGGGVLTAESLGEANDGMQGAKKGKTPPAHHLELEISKTTRCA